MKVFASLFLEKMSRGSVDESVEWSWEPECKDAREIYGSGANTSTRESTYADERDDRADTDRPNEGMKVA